MATIPSETSHLSKVVPESTFRIKIDPGLCLDAESICLTIEDFIAEERQNDQNQSLKKSIVKFSR
jgi:hypothetical protein